MTIVDARLEEVSIVDVDCDGGEEEVKKDDFVINGVLYEFRVVLTMCDWKSVYALHRSPKPSSTNLVCSLPCFIVPSANGR